MPRAEPSFLQEARRRQLVDCAIEVIAEVGLAGATLTRIAERAGISRGLVNYHVVDRDELLAAVVVEVYRRGRAEVGPSVDGAPTPRAKLLAFVAASVRFYHDHPADVAALGAIARDPSAGPGGRAAWAAHQEEMAALRTILLEGRAAGQFRDLDVDVAAVAVRSVLDTALRRPLPPAEDRAAGTDPGSGPGSDPESGPESDPVADELCAFVDAATRSHPPEVVASTTGPEER